MNFFNKNAWLALFAIIFFLFLPQGHATSDETKDYSLTRTIAAIEKAIDSYRLVLRELENIFAQFIEEAEKEENNANARHAAWRVTMQYAQKGLNNAAADELPPLLKMIHQDFE